MSLSANGFLDGRGAKLAKIGGDQTTVAFHTGDIINGDVHLHNQQDPPVNIIRLCLSLTPSPILDRALGRFKFVHNEYTRAKCFQHQLRVLMESLAQLLVTLDGEYRSCRILEANTKTAMSDLIKLLGDVFQLAQNCACENALDTTLRAEQRESELYSFHKYIKKVVASFKVSSPNDLQARELARVEDQEILYQRLSLITNDCEELKRMVRELTERSSSAQALIASLTRRSNKAEDERHRLFYSRSLDYLSAATKEEVKIERWTITHFDVEFGEKIGAGGFGEVFKGRWGKATVALKVLRVGDTVPSSEAVRREVVLWSELSHPNIIQLFGANVLDGRPFVVMPFLRHGNARDYITQNPSCNRLKILHDMSLGLLYLHNRNIIHGDIRGPNVLIEDSGRALLADFGLSRVKDDASSRASIIDKIPPAGSRNWMAPELFKGVSLRKPCDIYSFGMSIFEIYTNETPLLNIPYADFIEMIKNDVRPERPEDHTKPSDEIWRLAEICWTSDPQKRPSANGLSDIISHSSDVEGLLEFPPHESKTPTSRPPTPPLLRPGFFQTIRSRSWRRAHKEKQDGGLSPIEPLTRSSSSAETNPSVTPASTDRSPLKQIIRLDGHHKWVRSVAFSTDGLRVISGSDDKTIRTWDSRTGKQTLLLNGHTGTVRSVSFSLDGRWIVSGSHDTTIRIWDANSGDQVHELCGHTDDVHSVCFSSHGYLVTSGSADHSARVWHWGTEQQLKLLDGHEGQVHSVSFSPDNSWVVSGSSDETIRVWDARTGQQVQLLNAKQGRITSALFSPDAKWVVSSARDKTVCIWDIKSGKQIRKLDDHREMVSSATFSPNGRLIVSGSWDKTIRIWDLESGKIEKIDAHTESVLSCSFSRNGEQVVSGSADCSVRIWG